MSAFASNKQSPAHFSSAGSGSNTKDTTRLPKPFLRKRKYQDELNDQLHRELELDLKPPSPTTEHSPTPQSIMPRKISPTMQAKYLAKNNDAQRPWEHETPQPHPIEEIRLVEQAAKRLVAKSKEMLEPLLEVGIDHDTGEPKRVVRKGYLAKAQDVSEREKRELKWVHDLLVDAVKVVEGSSEKRKLIGKWEGMRKQWIEEGLTEE